jgi:hypothetical protein
MIDSAIAGGAAAADDFPSTKNQRDGTTPPNVHAESGWEVWEHFFTPGRRQHWQDSALDANEAPRKGAIGSSRDETDNSRAVSLCPNTPANVVPRLILPVRSYSTKAHPKKSPYLRNRIPKRNPFPILGWPGRMTLQTSEVKEASKVMVGNGAY